MAPIPDFKFGEKPHPPEPDYADVESDAWCAHPEKKTDDRTNSFVVDGVTPPPLAERPCDCFYVCGTNYFGGEHWNQPIDDAVASEWNKADVSFQGACFNKICRVFAPQYRQSIHPAHGPLQRASVSEEQRKMAYASTDLAYSDVERAFLAFLSQTQGSGRPFIVASHSQGTMHTIRLMEQVIDKDEDLRGRMVCGYLLGPCCAFPVDKFARCFPNLRPSTGPLDHTGCLIAFDNVDSNNDIVKQLRHGEVVEDPFPVRNKGADPPMLVRYGDSWESPVGKSVFCTNPLTWTSEPGKADESLYLGKGVAKLLTAAGTDADYGDCLNNRMVTGVTLKSIIKADVGSMSTEIAFDGGALMQYGTEITEHSEWEFFYYNVRENAEKRLEAYQAGKT